MISFCKWTRTKITRRVESSARVLFRKSRNAFVLWSTYFRPHELRFASKLSSDLL